MGCLIAILCVLYILSPVDLWPGVFDDLICAFIVLFGYYQHQKSISAQKNRKEKRRAREEQREREKREAEIKELDCIEKIMSRDTTTSNVASGFCAHCGYRVNSDATYCSQCGKPIEKATLVFPEGTGFCEACGSPLKVVSEDSSTLVCTYCGHEHLPPEHAALQMEKVRQKKKNIKKQNSIEIKP